MKRNFLFLIIVFPNLLLAQTIKNKLTLDEAIQIALEHNYDIKISKNQLQQASNSNTLGNAGWFPSLSAGGSVEYASKDSKIQSRSNGFMPAAPLVDAKGAETHTFIGNLRLDYTLFSGFSKIYIRKQLKENNERAMCQYRLQMENTILQTAQAYYLICSAYQQLDILQKSLVISADRLKRAKAQEEFGQAGTLDILNAEVDYNADSTRVLNAELNYKNSIRNLNVILGVSPETNYEVEDVVQFSTIENPNEIQAQAMQNNNVWLMQQHLQKMADLELKITKSQRYPTLSAYGTYGYYRQNKSIGTTEYMQHLGFTAGLSLRWNIFNGRQQAIREKNAALEMENAKWTLEKLKAQLQNDIANAYTDYDYKKRNVNLLEKSRMRAKLNFERTQELFRLGQVSSIVFRTAQQNYLNSENAYNEACYSAKLSEIILLKTAGQLVK